jgi:hypothetical protein
MDILQLIDRLEEFFNEGKAIPFTRTVAVDEDRMLDIIDQMRISIPEEVKKAQQLLTQKERVMAQAQEEANRTIEIAREKAGEMLKKDSVVAEAGRRAEQILTQARADAEATRHEADDYIVISLNRVQEEMERLLNQVRNGIRTLEEERMRRAPDQRQAPVSEEMLDK